jgi:hypothetical protein
MLIREGLASYVWTKLTYAFTFMHDKRVLFEDDNILAILLEGAREDAIIISFASMSVRPSGLNFWGDQLFVNLGYTAIGFVAKASNWYPGDSMLAAADKANSVVSRYKHVLLYGASMGGYGALKFGEAFNATHALVFSPQLSINPNELAFEERFKQYYVESYHKNMVVCSKDLAPIVFTFFDPFHKIDSNHVDLLLQIKPDANVIYCRRTGHLGIRLFASTERMRSLLQWCLSNDVEPARTAAFNLSRESKMRPQEIAAALAWKKPELAERIFETYQSSYSDEERAAFWRRMANIWSSKKNTKKQIEANKRVLLEEED